MSIIIVLTYVSTMGLLKICVCQFIQHSSWQGYVQKDGHQIGIKLLPGMALNFRFILKNDMEFRTSIIFDYNKKWA